MKKQWLGRSCLWAGEMPRKKSPRARAQGSREEVEQTNGWPRSALRTGLTGA
jgi:hypothetical protein